MAPLYRTSIYLVVCLTSVPVVVVVAHYSTGLASCDDATCGVGIDDVDAAFDFFGEEALQLIQRSSSFLGSSRHSTAGAPNVVDSGDIWGIDFNKMNRSAVPGDDWYGYVNGRWLEETHIPADRSSVTAFSEVDDVTKKQLHKLLVEEGEKGTLSGNLYASFMDERTLEERGASPVEPVLHMIQSMQTVKDFAYFAGNTNFGFGSSLFGLGVGPDEKDPGMNVAQLGQGGLGLPDREYYLSEKFAAKKQAYRDYIVKLFSLVNWAEPDHSADQVLAFEHEIAKQSWSVEDLRNPDKTYHKMTTDDIIEKAPGFPWAAFLEAAGPIPAHTTVTVGPWDEDAKNGIIGIAALVGRTDVKVLRAWSASHMLTGVASYLSKVFVDTKHEYAKALTGQPKQTPRWQRGVSVASSGLPDAVGQAYVAKHFPASSKKVVTELTGLLKAAFKERLEKVTWMTEDTRTAALKKLASFTFEVGYPSKWMDYTGVQMMRDDLFGNLERAVAFKWRWQKSQLNKPVDKAYWPLPPQMVNAFFQSNSNRCVFLAALLQPPFFDAGGDMAKNFGSIGAVIGHEMTHGFDDSGRKYDAQGRLNDWWKEADVKEFTKRAKLYGEQFGNWSSGIPHGLQINPELTMGENIADLGGVTIAHEALRRWLQTHSYSPKAPMLGDDGNVKAEIDRRFFAGWAQLWRARYRRDMLEVQLTTDPHSPGHARATVPLQNTEAWYSAYGVLHDQQLFLDPAKHVTIW